jgi:hypothetical protein
VVAASLAFWRSDFLFALFRLPFSALSKRMTDRSNQIIATVCPARQ